MSDLLIIYLGAAFMVSLGGAILAAVVRFLPALVAGAPERWHRWGWLLLGLALLLPAGWRLAGPIHRGPAAIEIWDEKAAWDGGPRVPRMSVRWSGGERLAGAAMRLEPRAIQAALGFGLSGMLISGALLAVRRRRLRFHCAGLPLIKRVGQVRLCADDRSPVPFAARTGGTSYVVVPTSLLSDLPRLRLVLSHEAHHLRRGDLWSALGLGLVRVLFFWNPIIPWWERALAELQDLACDRHVLRRRGVSPGDYGRCLLWAAEFHGHPRFLIGGARAMTSSAASLRRRMLALFAETGPARGGTWLVSGATAVVLLTCSWVVQAAVADRRISAAEVATMAAAIQQRSGFPVLPSAEVVESLNRKVATPEARDRMRAALARMPRYRAMIEQALRRKALPHELLAVPLTESAFNHEAQTSRPVERRSIGLWQMLPTTARLFGLEVSSARDERLNPVRDTDAATALLVENHARLRDWPLAIAAYNGGIEAVQALISGASIPEARARVLASTNTEYGRYLASVMASIILIENPQLVD